MTKVDRSSTKTQNLFWLTKQLDKLIAELSEDRNRNAELTHAKNLLLTVKFLVKAYSDRIRRTPNQ